MAFHHPRRLLTVATLIAFLVPALVAAEETTGRRRAAAPTPAAKKNLTPANLPDKVSSSFEHGDRCRNICSFFKPRSGICSQAMAE